MEVTFKGSGNLEIHEEKRKIFLRFRFRYRKRENNIILLKSSVDIFSLSFIIFCSLLLQPINGLIVAVNVGNTPVIIIDSLSEATGCEVSVIFFIL